MGGHMNSMNMNRKKIFAILMAILTIIAFMPTADIGATAAQRERLNQLQQQRDQQRTQIRETENLLSGFRSEIEDLLEVMRDYSQRMMDAYADMEEIEIVLLETEIALEDALQELAIASENRDAQDEIFRTRLRVMHERGNTGYLDVLLQATSFTDFLVRLEQMRAISQADQQVLADRQAAEERVENTVNELSRLTTLFEDMHIQHQIAIAALEEAQEANAVFLYALRYDEAGAALLLEVERATERAIAEEMGVIDRQIREHEAQEAARRAAEAQRQRQADNAARTARLAGFEGQFRWPIPTHSHISSGFGTRTHPIRRTREHHTGIDVPAPAGTRIIAAADGYVRLSGWHGGFGNTVIIDHGEGYSTLYAHNSRNRVSVGQFVTAGTHIADVGTTGVSTGNHLHFEIRMNNVPRNPMRYFPGF